MEVVFMMTKLFVRQVLNALKSTEMSSVKPIPVSPPLIQRQTQPPLLLSGSMNYIKLN